MRVLLVNDWTETGGGVERYVSDVLAALRAAGDDVCLLAARAGDAPSVADELVRTSERPAAQAFLQVVNPFAVRGARRVVRAFRPDVALVSMFEMRLSPAVVAALHPVPVVLNVAYYKTICPAGLKLLPDGAVCARPAGRVYVHSGCVGNAHWLRVISARYALIGRAVRGAAAVVTCSEHMRSCLARAGIAALHAPWPTASVPDGFARAPGDEPVIVYAGRLAREKGVVELVRAFASGPAAAEGARLEILGDGPLRPRLEVEIAAAGLDGRVALRGWAGRAELDGSWPGLAVVVPSVWEEPLGLVALEAVVRGVPVVATRSGGLVEIVDHGRTGLLVPPGALEQVSAALLEIVTGGTFPEHRVDPGAAAALAQRHDPAAHAAWLRDVLARASA